MGINLVVLTSELESPSFLVLMFLRVPQGEPKSQRLKQSHAYILDLFNKFSKVLIDTTTKSVHVRQVISLDFE